MHLHSTKNRMSVPGYGSIQCFAALRHGATGRRNRPFLSLGTAGPGFAGCTIFPSGGPGCIANALHNGCSNRLSPEISATNAAVSGSASNFSTRFRELLSQFQIGSINRKIVI